jgi:diguanylate cyclase (GGDEF)-like protein
MDQEILTSIDTRIDDAYLLTYKSLAEAEKLVEICLDDSEQNEYFAGTINAKILLTLISVQKGESDLVRDKLSRIEEELKSFSSDDSQMRLAHVRGLYFLKDGVYRDSFDSFVKAGNLAARLGNQLFQALSANGKGFIKLGQREFQDSHHYFNVAKTFLLDLPPSILNTVLSVNLACSLNGLNRDEEAFLLLEAALKYAQEEHAEILECSILDEMAQIHMKNNRLKEARVPLKKGLDLSKRLVHSEIRAELVYHYAALLLREGEYDAAEDFIQKFGMESKTGIQKSMFHKIAADIYEQKGEFQKALASHKIVNEIHERVGFSQSVHSVLMQEKRELQDQNHRLSLMSIIGQELVANLDIGKILDLIYTQLNVLMPVDLLSVAMVNEDEIDVKFSIKEGERLQPFVIHKENQDSILAWSVRNDKEIFMRSIYEESNLYAKGFIPAVFKGVGRMESVICLPLRYLDQIVGVLTVQCNKKNSYTTEDLENLRALATYAGIALRNARQTERMSELNEDLRRQSSQDSLTGLATRREFARQSSNIWRICRRNSFWISIIMIDLDHFKEVNDTHGHASGDEVLKKFGDELNHYFKRPLDCAARYGGEELLILAGDMCPREAAMRVELLREEISSFEFESDKGKFTVNFSCGIIGEVPKLESDAGIAKLTDLADRYLYEAKNNGRNCTYLSDQADQAAKKFIISHTK